LGQFILQGLLVGSQLFYQEANYIIVCLHYATEQVRRLYRRLLISERYLSRFVDCLLSFNGIVIEIHDFSISSSTSSSQIQNQVEN
jgi:hypothetical protein